MDTELDKELKNIMDTKLDIYGFFITEYNNDDREIKYQRYCYATSNEEAEEISFNYASQFRLEAPSIFNSKERLWTIYKELGGITWEVSIPEKIDYISIQIINGDTINIYL